MKIVNDINVLKFFNDAGLTVDLKDSSSNVFKLVNNKTNEKLEVWSEIGGPLGLPFIYFETN